MMSDTAQNKRFGWPTSCDGFRLIWFVDVRCDELWKLNARFEFWIQNVELVKEYHKFDRGQKLVATYFLPEPQGVRLYAKEKISA